MNTKTKFLVSGVVVLFAGSLLLGVASCGRRNRTATSQLSSEARRVLKELERAFNRENYSGVLALVHSDYRQFKNELRSDLREVFSDYTQPELEFYSSSVNAKDEGINVDTRWNLRWVNSNGQTIRRKGRTTFGLTKDSTGEWKLKAQRGDRVLGGLAPGNRMHP